MRLSGHRPRVPSVMCSVRVFAMWGCGQLRGEEPDLVAEPPHAMASLFLPELRRSLRQWRVGRRGLISARLPG